jgi:aspartate dehydrogenase
VTSIGTERKNRDRKRRGLKVGIVGCGALGGQLARALGAGAISGVSVAALCDLDPARARRTAGAVRPRPRVGGPEAMRGCDLVVEAAGAAAVPSVAAAAQAAGADLLVMSVGALLSEPKWAADLRRRGLRLLHPSGAVAGLDGLRAAARGGGLKRVVLTTRKPPKGLAGAPFFRGRPRALAGLRGPRVIFRGSARQAVRAFPANVNVAAAVALAGLGPDRTRVVIIADPAAQRNSHTLLAEGEFGRLTAVTENRPSPDNPRTSRLAGASALALITDWAGMASGGGRPRARRPSART